MASSGNFHLHVPEDLLIEILCRLPAKSLLRFKCVCKYWCSLIQSPYFVGKHIHHPKNHRRLLVHRCIDNDEQNDGNDLSPFVLFDETLAGNPPVHHNLDYMRSVHYLSHILGPVNGLFLLHNSLDDRNNRVALWNPATTQFRPLPPPLVFLHPPYDSKHVLGFGLDILTNDYKVVWIQINDCLDDNDPPVVCVQLYTLGTDSWRQIEIDDPVLLDSIVPLGQCNKSNTYFNGVYYWLSSFGCSSGCKATIVSFDMDSDVFREVKKPDATAAIAQLFVLNNGSIAVALAEPELSSVDVWVMEKDQDFWTKHLTIGTGNPLRFGTLIEFWNKKEIFFLTAETGQLVLYNTDTHEIRDLGIRCICGCMPGAHNYKESLVSVKGGQMESWNKDNMHDVIQDFSAAPWEENVPE